jgi:hypothetical protein
LADAFSRPCHEYDAVIKGKVSMFVLRSAGEAAYCSRWRGSPVHRSEPDAADCSFFFRSKRKGRKYLTTTYINALNSPVIRPALNVPLPWRYDLITQALFHQRHGL